MDDEQRAPQDQDAEEVEAHSRRPAPSEEPARAAHEEDDDEVEGHFKRPAPSESRIPNPSE